LKGQGQTQEYTMRKTLLALPVAATAAAALVTSASAQPPNYPEPYAVAPAAGVVAGTVVGLGFSEGWWSSPAALGTVGGAATVGLVAGVGTMALIHSVTTPCHGFRIGWDSPEECARLNALPQRTVDRRVRRR
jgi:hypothetical protein